MRAGAPLVLFLATLQAWPEAAATDDSCAYSPVIITTWNWETQAETAGSSLNETFKALPSALGAWPDSQLNLPLLLHVASPAGGCNASGADFAGGAVLLERGACSFADKVANAAAANASLAIVYNNEPGCVLMGEGATMAKTGVVAVSVSRADGRRLVKLAGAGVAVQAWLPAPGLGAMLNASDLLLFALAVGTLVLGARAAGADYLKECQCLAGDAGGRGSGGDGGGSWAPPVTVLGMQHALGFVVFASAVLLLVFFLLSHFFIIVLVVLFCLAGASSLTLLFAEGLACAAPGRCGTAGVPLPWLGLVPAGMMWAVGLAVGMVGAWAALRATPWGWPLQDAMAVAMMVVFLRQYRLPSLKVAAMLLVGALAYDVFWVFVQPWVTGGSSVMVDVATGGAGGEDMPLLLRVPHWRGAPGESVLGFGDVLLPGLLAGWVRISDLAARRGARRAYLPWVVAGYCAGLAATYAALLFAVGGDQGQPALLYVVPCTLGTLMAVAAARRQLSVLWAEDLRPSQKAAFAADVEDAEAVGDAADRERLLAAAPGAAARDHGEDGCA